MLQDFFKSVMSAVTAVARVPIVSRSFHTFWQGFLATFVVGVPLVIGVVNVQGIDSGKKALVSLIVAGCMAGLSALKTSIVMTAKPSHYK